MPLRCRPREASRSTTDPRAVITEEIVMSNSDQHIALLGDSIFDNSSYTDGAPDVIAHLRAGLPTGWRASLLAVDGSTTEDLAAQVARVPADVTHIVVSVGGNDALLNSDVLSLPVSSTAQALEIFRERASRFRSWYTSALDAV